VRDPFPPWLEALVDRLLAAGLAWGSGAAWARPNTCLVNEYAVGQGIMPHADGPAFLPRVATVSLGGSCALELVRHGGDPLCAVLLEPGSLLVLGDEAYAEHMHGIAPRVEDGAPFANDSLLGDDAAATPLVVPRERTRVSLTFRRTTQPAVRDAAASLLAKMRGRAGRR